MFFLVMQHRLYELRKAKNITQQRLAIELGIDQGSISSYEGGKYLPTMEILLRLAEYFGVSTDYLLGLSDVKTPLKFAVDDQAAYMLSLFESLPGNYRERVIGYAEALKEQS